MIYIKYSVLIWYLYFLGKSSLDDVSIDHLVTLTLTVTLNDPSGSGMVFYKHVMLLMLHRNHHICNQKVQHIVEGVAEVTQCFAKQKDSKTSYRLLIAD